MVENGDMMTNVISGFNAEESRETSNEAQCLGHGLKVSRWFLRRFYYDPVRYDTEDVADVMSGMIIRTLK